VAALACRRDYGCDLLVAEVEGGSLESFYQSVLIKSCFDHHRQSGYDGHAFIRFLNKSLLEGSLGKLPTNVLFARIFLEQKRMEMISAGHPFLTYLSATGAQPRSFLASGDPLGLSEDIRIEPRVFPFESGDRIFLHTRSLAVAARSESLGGGDRARLGPERLDDLIMAYRKGNLDAMVEKIWQHVLDASRTRSNHDMFFWGIQIP
jgi:serine phosphatase RsbU (regulator of sigma subunit)